MINYKNDSQLLKVLGHSVRLRIVENLIEEECNVNRIINILSLPQSTVSQHLGILKAYGIVVARKEGVKTCYRVVDNKVKRIIRELNK